MTPPDANAPIVRAFSLTIDRAALATREEHDERIPIAISSEFPVKRYDWQRDEVFNEVLDHSPSSVNLGRALRGLPFIPSHQSQGSEVFGKVVDIRVDADKVMRGWVRFSKSARAQEVRQDMLDDIRTEVSVGYDPGTVYTETREGNMLTRRYTNWTPYEVSTVSVPADPTVGKDRAHSAATGTTTLQPGVTARGTIMDTEQVAAAPVAPAVAPVVSDVRSRAETIYGFAIAAGLSSSETQTLVNSGRDVDSIGREMLERMNKSADHSGAPKPAVVLTDKETRQFSLMRALESVINGKRGFEMEVSDEFAKATGRSYTNDKSFFLPFNLRTQLSVAGANKGGELRATELRPELIDMLRQKSLVLGTLGARFLPGLQGNVSFPRQTAGATAVWVTEAPGSDVALSSLSLDQVTLSPKTLQAATTVSRQLLAQSTPAADQIVFDDLIAQHATAIDMSAFWGPGTAVPTGVGVAAGTNLVAMATNGLAMTLAKTLEALRVLETSNAMTDNTKLVTTPGVKYSMGAIARFASTDSRTLWDLDTNTVFGNPGYSTNNIPSNLVKGSSGAVCHGAIVGDFSQVLVGEWGSGAEIIVDPFTLARRNMIAITSIQFVDVQIRTPASFAVFRDILI